MSTLLFIIGAISLVLGTTTIGYGIPINEFSFGNTLIIAGTTAAVGGLIVIGLGAVVAHLNRLAQAMALRASPRPARAADVSEDEPVPTTGRFPFAPKPPVEAPQSDLRHIEPHVSAGRHPDESEFDGVHPAEPHLAEPNLDEPPMGRRPFGQPQSRESSLGAPRLREPRPAATPRFSQSPAVTPHPTEPRLEEPLMPAAPPRWPRAPEPAEESQPEAPRLRNPELPPSPEETPSTPPHRFSPAELAGGELGERAPSAPSGLDASAGERSFRPAAPAWRTPPTPPAEPPLPSQEPYFEGTWPGENMPAPPQSATDRSADRLEERYADDEKGAARTAAAAPEAEPATPLAPVREHRAVAILKSGVVDGMGYTLYVDGSIEAELPQGTLRFASINDLREHLEKGS